MAYTPLGYSLPDLTVQGFTAPTAAWGSPLTVTVDVKNTGSSTLIEPLALQPGATSTSDAGPTQVVVYATPQNGRSTRRAVQIGVIDIPGIPQNDVQQFTGTFQLPSRPPGFAKEGGVINVFFQVNPTRNILESDFTNNNSRKSPVLIAAPLPKVAAVGLALPPTLQPGDTIQPNIQVANFGTVDTSTQGPITVALVASVDRKFGPGSSVIALYTLDNISGIDTVPSTSQAFGQSTINTPNNVATIIGNAVTLPDRPRNYYIGVVVDPSNSIKQLGKIGRHRVRTSGFSLIHKVGPPIAGLPPAGVVVPGNGDNNQPFPFPLNPNTKVGNPIFTDPPSIF
ncbi:hypothetical protein Sinac_1132 [Singulisphaera acidiphila DSM 18658]|uniref:CARDB domain-containing protein n=2 Tax=Singulisphaera acidiphila TaxID=466153 RepID=L0D9M2_SINAD|nr:hypothetical protein Sinac_1132 [Singulisphaera acidiphila DSM 18658]